MAQNLYGEFDQILKQAAVDGLDEKQVQQYALDLLKTRVIEPLKAKGANADTINRGTQLFWNRAQGVIVANGFNQAPNESVEDMMQRRADIAASNSPTLSAVRDAKTVAKGVGFALSAPFRKYAAGANNLAASGATLLNDYLNTDENGVPLTDTGLAQFAQSQKDAANAHRAAVPAYKSDNTFAGDLMQNASELGGSITESLPTLVLGGGIGGAAAKGVMAIKGAGATAKTAVAAGLTGAVAASPVEFSANYGEARDKTIQTLNAQKQDGTFEIPDDALAQNVPEYKQLYDVELKKSGDPVKAADYARKGTVDILARGSATKSAAIMQAISLIAPSAGGMMANRVAGSTVDVVGNPVSKALNKLGIKAPTLDAKAAQRAADQMAGKKVNRYTGIGSPTLALREGVEEATQEAAMNATVEDTRATASGTDFNADAINQNLGTSFLAGAIMGKGANMAIQGTESTQARAKVQAMYQNKSNIEMAIPVQEQRIAEMQSRTDIDPAVVQEQIQVLETLKQQRAKITEDMTALGLPPTDPSIQAEPPVNPVVDETGQPIEETLTPEDQQRFDEIFADLADAQPVATPEQQPTSGLAGVAERAMANNPTNVNVSVPPDMTQQLVDQARANMDQMTNELGIKAPSAQPKVELTPDSPEITITPDGTPVQQQQPTEAPQQTPIDQPVQPAENDLAGEYQHSQIADAKAIVRKTEKGYEIEWSPDDIQSFSGKTAAVRVGKALKKEGYQAPIAATTTTQPVEQQTQSKPTLESNLQAEGFEQVPIKSDSMVKYTKVDDIGQHTRVYDKLDGSLIRDNTTTQYEGGVNAHGEPFTLKIIRDNENGKVFQIQMITPDGFVTRLSGGMPISDAKIIQGLESVADVLPNPTPVRPTKIAKKFTFDDKPVAPESQTRPIADALGESLRAEGFEQVPIKSDSMVKYTKVDDVGQHDRLYNKLDGSLVSDKTTTQYEGGVNEYGEPFTLKIIRDNQSGKVFEIQKIYSDGRVVRLDGGMPISDAKIIQNFDADVSVLPNPTPVRPTKIKKTLKDDDKPLFSAPRKKPTVTPMDAIKNIQEQRLDRAGLAGKYVRYAGAEGFVQQREDGLYVIDSTGNQDVLIEGGLSGKSPTQLGVEVVDNPSAPARDAKPADIKGFVSDQAKKARQDRLKRSKLNGKYVEYGKAEGFVQAREDGLYVVNTRGNDVRIDDETKARVIENPQAELTGKRAKTSLFTPPSKMIKPQAEIDQEREAGQAEAKRIARIEESAKANQAEMQAFDEVVELLVMTFGEQQAESILAMIEEKLGSDLSRSTLIQEITNEINQTPTVKNAEKAAINAPNDAARSVTEPSADGTPKTKKRSEKPLIPLRQEANQLIDAGLLKRTQVTGDTWKDADKLSEAVEIAKADPATLTTHKDVGEPVEIVTAEVIQDSMRMASENTKRPISEMKQDLLNQIDQAMKTAKVSTDVYDKIYREVKGKGFTYSIKTRGSQNTWKDQYFEVTNDWYELLGLKEDIISLEIADRIHEVNYREILDAIEENLNQIRSIWGEIGKVVFDIKGNGKFSVANETYALSEFRKKVAKRFKDPLTKEKAKSDGSSSSAALAIKNLVQDFEDKFSAQNAANLALANGRVAFGGTLDEPIMFGLVEDVSIAGVPMLIGLEIYRPQKNITNAGNWRILDPKTGLFLGNFESSKTAAIKAAESKMKTILKSKNIAPEQFDTLSIYKGGTPPSEVERENAWYDKYFNDPEYRKAFGDEISQVEDQPFVEPEKDKLSDLTKKFAFANWIGDIPKVRHFFNELVRNEYLTTDDAFKERYKAADAKTKNDMIYQMILDSFTDDIGLAEKLKSMSKSNVEPQSLEDNIYESVKEFIKNTGLSKGGLWKTYRSERATVKNQITRLLVLQVKKEDAKNIAGLTESIFNKLLNDSDYALAYTANFSKDFDEINRLNAIIDDLSSQANKTTVQSEKDVLLGKIQDLKKTIKAIDANISVRQGVDESSYVNGRRIVGKNSEGKTVYEDARGIRSVEIRDGVFDNEDVTIQRMSGGEIKYKAENRTNEFLTVDELPKPQANSYDFSKMGTIKEQIDTWLSLKRGDVVFDHRGNEVGTLADESVSVGLSLRTARFNRPDGTLESLSLSVVSGGGAPIIASLDARNAINEQEIKRFKTLETNDMRFIGISEFGDGLFEDAQGKRSLVGQATDRFVPEQGDSRRDAYLTIDELNQDRIKTQARKPTTRTRINPKPELPAESNTAAAPTRRQKILVKIDDELDAALDALADVAKQAGGRMNSGVDPTLLAKFLVVGVKASVLFLAKGAIEFSVWAENMIAGLQTKGVEPEQIKPYLKQLYLASKVDVSPEIRKQMTKEDDVLDFDLDTLGLQEDEQDTPSNLVDYLYEDMKAGSMITTNLVLKHRAAKFYGVTIGQIDNAQLKTIQESFEAALARHARDIVKANRDGTASTYDQLVRMYESQPNLNIRTSTSVANQAYSTPAPLAFIASKMAGIDANSTVYEPTAGNGMLLIAANPENTTANELEDTRFQNLQSFGVGKVAQGDALKAIESGVVAEKSQDVIITNPPFGSLKDAQGNTIKIPVDGFKIGKIDHLIAIDALRAMKDNGSAAIIIGADKVQGGLSTDDRIFFNYLYSNYNVTSHFEVDGGLYARQGASWPVRVIIVKGRQQSEQRSPKEGVIQRVDTWEGVYEQYNKLLVTDNSRESSGSADGANIEQRNESGTVPTGVSTKPNPVDSAGRKSETNADDVNGTSTGNVSTRKRTGGKRNTTTDRIDAPNIRPDERTNAQDNLEVGDKRDTGGVTKSPEPSVSGSKPNGAAGKSALTLTDADNAFQVKYTPMSSRKDEGVLIPTNMKQPLMDSLAVLSDVVGDIDQYAADELGYDSVSTLHDALMGLQVDSVASAIHQIKEKNKGIIIADQTGIGKGRQAAAIIRWAEKNGFIPVFITVKPQLFTDMYYDLADIGSNNIAPFIFNSDSAIVEKDGNKIFGNKAKNEYNSAFDDMTALGKLPDGRNAVFLTYSQINRKDNKQQAALRNIAHRAVFIMDESHNAGGESSTGTFMQEALGLSAGVVYLSATYAKRPDNMPLYFKTDMGIAADESSDISDAMSMGGLPLQTVVSNSLVKAGQLFRRERSYDGVRIDTLIDAKNGKDHEQLSDQVTKALRAIVTADRHFHESYFKQASDEAESSGGSAKDIAGNQADKSIGHTEFSSVVHNFIRQMLLGMKVDRAADEAIQALKEGRKPLIAVENTMGSFLNEYAAASGLSEGDSLGNFSYKNVLKRALDRSRALIIVDEKGNEVRKTVPLSDLSPFVRDAYKKAGEIIDNLQVEGLPVSPIDWMRYRIQEAGYTVAEITGRNMAVDYTDPKSPVLSRVPTEEQTDKVATTRAFNNGSLDAVILNVSGSTGISLHASEKFEDQRQRHMIVAQPAQDINIFMQMLGRIHRTGQVTLPRYSILSLDLPTEKRPTAILNKKMRSLNANTSSNTESATSIQAMDMLNKYGDKIITDFLLENPKVQEQLDISVDTDKPSLDIARKATGRMALLSMKDQYRIYSEIEPQYEALIKYLDETNQNDLEPKTIDYAADLMKEAVIVPATDPSTPFGQEAVFGIYRVKPQGVPMTIAEITELAKGNLSGFANGRLFADDLIQKTNAKFADYRSEFMGDEENTPDDRLQELQMQFVKQEATATQTRGWIENTRIGTGWMVKIGGEDYNAIVTNVRTTFKEGSTGNPYSASKWLVTIAVNGALRQVTMPKTEWDRVAQGQIHSDIRQAMVQREDDASIARIITGNLLAAYTKLVGAEGRVITFTKKDGTAEQGILLPRTFTMEANVRQDMAIKEPDQILKVLRSGLADIQRFGLASRRGDIAVNFSDANFIVVVPKSKAMGGKWFLNRALTEITGDFVSQGQKQMIAKIPLRNQEQILKALRYIVGKTPLYVMPSMVDEVRDLLGLGLNNPKMSIANQKPVGISSRKTKNILVNRFGQAAIDKLMDDGVLEIVQSAADLPASVRSKVSDPSQIEGFYDPSTGKITMVAGNLSADQVVPVLLHELGGHGSFQTMTKPDIYEKLMAAFDAMVERGNAIAIKARDRSNASNPSNPQDEYLAYLLSEAATAQNNANKQGVMRFAKRIMSAFKAWVFDKFGVSLRLNPDDMVALAERMISRRNTTPPKGTRSNADGFNPAIDKVRREHEGKPTWMKAPNGKPTNLTERQWLQVRTPEFKAWFGDWENDPKNASKAVDENSEPLVTYHGTIGDFNEFNSGEGVAIWVSDSVSVADRYAHARSHDVADKYQSIMPLYVKAKSIFDTKDMPDFIGTVELFFTKMIDQAVSKSLMPESKRKNVLDIAKELDGLAVSKGVYLEDHKIHHLWFAPNILFGNGGKDLVYQAISIMGFDAIQYLEAESMTIGVLSANQIKSAIGNTGRFDSNNPDIRFSMLDGTKDFLAETALRVGFGKKSFKDYIGDKLNTMLHLSLIDPQFKVAFSRLQNKLNQVATDSYASIQAAPELLGHIETFKDVVHLVKGINPFTNAARKADMAAAAEALFQGTLVDRKVFTDKELRDYFSLNDYQIKIYRDSRNAIDLALDRATRSAIMKTIMDAGAEYDAHIKPMLSEDLSLDEVNRRARQFMRDMVSERPMGSTEREKAEGIREAVLEQLDGILAKRQKLSDQGYAPLMRFGDYWLTVKNKEDGTTELHQRFESEGEREVALRRLKKGNVLDNAIHEVSTGKDNPERHKLFRGVSPEAMMLFAKELGMEGDDATQAYLRLATANQSALRRLIHRKGIAGYSEDLQRVLAAFVMSSARHSSHMIFNEPILEAIRGIENADHQRQAMDMNEFALNPVEQARVFKNLLFIWNMGASLMFGLINMTQPFTQTFPFLTQEVGMKAVKGIYKGWFSALKSFGSNVIPAEYQAEYERAQREGHLDPANVWMLQGIERGSSGVYHNIWTLIQQGMGFIAQATETVNRRTTLFAALEAAKSMSKEQIEQYGTPYDFAVQAIQETQGIYNKANRPKLSRTWAGDLLMVYKQFSIAYVEQMIRMQRNRKWNGKEDKSPFSRALMLMLGIIFSFAGSMGLPFAQNVADIGSAAFGWAGKPTQFEYEFEKGMQEWLGDDNGKMVADAIKYGVFNLNGIVDVQGRMSIGNLIPATGLLNPAASEFDRNSSVANLFGASGGLSKQMTEAYQLMGMGEYSEAAVRALPRAFTSLAKSSEMLSTGKYTNKAGNVVTDATTFEAIVKALDGNPARVADEQRALMRYYSAKAIRDGVQKRLNDDLLKAKIDGNSEDAAQVAERIRTWNAENPEYRVKINHATLRRKLREQGVANWRDRAPSSKGLEWALEKEDE